MDQPDGAWGVLYDLAYERHSRKNRQRREARREADARHRARQRAEGKGPTPDELAFLDLAQARRASRLALVELRWSRGFVWHGGPVGGRADYRRPSFVYCGLVSDEAPILRRFVAAVPKAVRLITGDTKAEASPTDSKLLACDSPYIEGNKAMRSILRVELDRVFAGGFNQLAAEVAALGCPAPNLVVGYVDAAGHLHNPHLIWLLADAVNFMPKGRRAHQGLWRRVLDALTARLLPIGADPGGVSNAMRMKNPLSPLWDRAVGAEVPYSLTPDEREGAPGFAALAPFLDLEGAPEQLKAAAEARRGRPLPEDHPDPAINGQSNALFRYLAEVAKRRVRWHRDHGNGSPAEFEQELAAEALRVVPGGRAAERAAAATASTVAAWTWANYGTGSGRVACGSPQELKERLAAGAHRAASAKTNATVAAVAKAIQRLSAGGAQATKPAVAAAVGKSLDTVKRQWKAALALIEGGCISPVIDKKGAAGSAPLSTAPAPAPLAPPAPLALPPALPLPHPRSPRGAEAARPLLWPGVAETPCGPPGMPAPSVPPATPPPTDSGPPPLYDPDAVPW